MGFFNLYRFQHHIIGKEVGVAVSSVEGKPGYVLPAEGGCGEMVALTSYLLLLHQKRNQRWKRRTWPARPKLTF